MINKYEITILKRDDPFVIEANGYSVDASGFLIVKGPDGPIATFNHGAWIAIEKVEKE